MKTKITALALLTVSALSFAPKPAVASDKGLAIVGGFLGGLIVASAINDSHYDHRSSNYTTVLVDDRCDDRSPAGYWKEVSVRVWVPGCWIVERDYRGCDRRRYVEGRYECRNDRVWVAHNRHDRDDRRDRDDRYDRDDRDDRRDRHHDREVSYDYGHRR